MFLRTLAWISAAAIVVGLCGCSGLFNQHAQTMDAMRGVMADTAARLSASGTGQIAAGGEVINPGIRVAAGVEYYAVARYEGVSGQVQAGMSGGLDRSITPEAEARAAAIWRDTILSDREKLERLFALLRLFPRQVPNANAAASQPAAEDGE